MNKQKIEIWSNNDLHEIQRGIQYAIDNDHKQIVSIGLVKDNDEFKAIVVYEV